MAIQIDPNRRNWIPFATHKKYKRKLNATIVINEAKLHKRKCFNEVYQQEFAP